MPTILGYLIYWIAALLLTLLDYSGWLSKHKVQPGKNQRTNPHRGQGHQSGALQPIGGCVAAGGAQF
jgi:hypothetical protein